MIKPSHQQVHHTTSPIDHVPDHHQIFNTNTQSWNPAGPEVGTNSSKDRTGRKGTREWSDKSYNICIGCEHGCLYCYAKSNRCRFDNTVRAPGQWQKQRLNPKRSRLGAEVGARGVVMFPTAHDIVPAFMDECLTTIKNLLAKNCVLVVTKPHLSVVKYLCENLADDHDRLLFRFTIGSPNPTICRFWEPGAPEPSERFLALMYAWQRGYATSVSIEPMLDSVDETMRLVKGVDPFVTDSIWIGKMQRIPVKHNLHVAGFAQARDRIRNQQRDEEILRLVSRLQANPKVRWKDSVQKVLAKYQIK